MEAKDKYSIFISVNDLNGQPIKNAKTRLLNESGKKIANTKSVSFSGRKSRLLWEPSRKPLPFSPPEPIAILDCII